MEAFYSIALFCEQTKYFTAYKNRLKKFIDDKENLAFATNEKLSEEFIHFKFHFAYIFAKELKDRISEMLWRARKII